MRLRARLACLARSRARRAPLTAALAVIGALALGAAAPAPSTAAGWSPAMTVSDPHDAISNLGLASGASVDMVSGTSTTSRRQRIRSSGRPARATR